MELWRIVIGNYSQKQGAVIFDGSSTMTMRMKRPGICPHSAYSSLCCIDNTIKHSAYPALKIESSP
eukprot:10411278-Ditylum_brightwellii.AAC.1